VALLERVEDVGLRARVDRAQRVVQDQDGRILEECARDGDALPLAAGQGDPPLADHGVVAVVEVDDRVVDAGRARRAHDLLLARPAEADLDVGPQGLREQEGLLQDDADPVAHPRALQGGELEPVEADRAVLVVVQTQEQVDDRGLPRARRSEQGEGLAGADVEGDVPQDLLAVAVREAKPLDADVALEDVGDVGARRVVIRLLGHSEDLPDAAEGDDRLARLGQHPPEVTDGPDDHRLVHQERLQVPDREPPGDRPVRAEEQHHADLGQAEEVGRGPVDAEQVDQLLGPVTEVGVASAELAALELLAGEGPDHSDPGEVLLQDGGHRSLRLVHLQEPRLDLTEEDDGEGDDEREQGDGGQRHPDVDVEQDGDHGDEQDRRPADLDHLGGKEHPHRLHVGGAPLDQVPGVRPVVVRARQPLEVRVQPIPQIAGDRLGGHGRPPAAQVVEGPADRGQRQHPGRRAPQELREGRVDPQRRARAAEPRGHDVSAPLEDAVDRPARDERRPEDGDDPHRHRRDGGEVPQTLTTRQLPQGPVRLALHVSVSSN